MVPVVREVLSVIPAGCSWLLPVTGPGGAVTDFRIGAASGPHDLYRRGTDRVDRLLSELYPSIVGGPLWQVYLEVLRTGAPAELREWPYQEKQTYDITVEPVLGGLLVWFQRLDEDRLRMERTELLGSLGWIEYDLITGETTWSPGTYRIFGRDPEQGPMSRAEQAATSHPEDRGLIEAAWQRLAGGGPADVTVRFRAGDRWRHLRILSDLSTDADGAPLKINAVVQDVTTREDTRTAMQRLRDEMHAREMTALAEHRLAGQLQELIQPVPAEPFALPGLAATANYQPAGNRVRVGGDWYHCEALPDGRTLLAVGDMAGHGLPAANGMAHLRFALIAWLSIGILDPGELLGHLNRLSRRLRLTGTAVVGVFDPATDTFTWGRAGHAAPLLGRAGTAGPLEMPPGLLLGADDAATYPVMPAKLAADDLLLLFTDGLVERRERDLLDEVVETLATASLSGSLAALTRSLGRPSPDDDTCTLAVRVLPKERAKERG